MYSLYSQERLFLTFMYLCILSFVWLCHVLDVALRISVPSRNARVFTCSACIPTYGLQGLSSWNAWGLLPRAFGVMVTQPVIPQWFSMAPQEPTVDSCFASWVLNHWTTWKVSQAHFLSSDPGDILYMVPLPIGTCSVTHREGYWWCWFW